MNEESKKLTAKKLAACPMPKPHPTSVMKKTLRFMREDKMPYAEAKERAKAETLKEGKFHGMSKMKYDICQIAHELENEGKEK